MEARIFRLEMRRLAEAGNRLVDLARFLEERAEIIQCFGPLRTKCYGTLQVLDRFLAPAGVHQGQRDIELIIGRRWIDGDRFGNQFDRFFMIALLVRQDAEQIQSIGVIRLLGEDLVVKRLGFGQSPGAMVFDGGIEQL